MSAPVDLPLYLDNAASTPPADEVIEAMLPWLRHTHANPHSEHFHGRRAADAVEAARDAVAELIGANVSDVVFTSGATEANNLALKGLLSAAGPRRHLWLSDIEHKSLREPARALASQGVTVTRIAVDARGRIAREAFADAMEQARATPGLVAITHGNNEIGTVQPIAEIEPYVRGYGHWLHVDASQSAVREPIDVLQLRCDLLCLSSHKLYGPGGIGALYVAPDLRGQLQPQMHGGGQEGGLRSGTVPPFLAVGFGVAARMALRRMDEDRAHLRQLAGVFERYLIDAGIPYELIGDPESRLPGHLSLRFPGIDAEDLLAVLGPKLSASTGAACAAGELRASQVLRALGLDEQTAGEVVRLSFGRGLSLELAEWAADQVAHALHRIRDRND